MTTMRDVDKLRAAMDQLEGDALQHCYRGLEFATPSITARFTRDRKISSRFPIKGLEGQTYAI